MNNEQMIKSKAWLGLFVAFHSIGEYSFVEYHPIVFDGISPKIPREYHKHTHFSPFVCGKDVGQSFENIDYALAHAIAYKHDGANTRADEYFMRAITSNP